MQLRDVRGDVASPEEAKEAFELAAKQLKVTREPASLCAFCCSVAVQVVLTLVGMMRR